MVLWDSAAGLAVGPVDRPTVDRRLAGSNGLVHDPARLAAALAGLAGMTRPDWPAGTGGVGG